MKPVSLLILFALLLCLAVLASAGSSAAAGEVEQWGIFEAVLPGPAGGNPFVESDLSARFSNGKREVAVDGFYDGEGSYRLRFMPDEPGEWRFRTRSNRPELDGKSGAFTCAPATGRNHGPVRVRNTYHFGYADGTPYLPFGTTCYAWTHQGEALETETLKTLAASPFNKLRMCVFPKRYLYNENEPELYPFEGTPTDRWDFSRFNPAFFRHLERRVGDLRALGIEADLILFHPYDKGHWGFDRMPAGADDRYLRYVVARLAAYRNVWWSMANEFDFMKEKTPADWDRFFQIVQRSDPYDHLRSIHNGTRFYDHNKPWVTHASIQNGQVVADFGRAELLRTVYEKPVVYDEARYEGNIERRWGNLSAEEMVLRFWHGTVAGTYVGHGESYLHPRDILWWSKGGVLHGHSAPRIAFLRRLLEEDAPGGIDPVDKWMYPGVAGRRGEYYLRYFGEQRPTEWKFELPRGRDESPPENARFHVDVIDTWGMTITPVERTFPLHLQGDHLYTSDAPPIPLPGKPYLALRIRRL